jgi:WD40 repeat protein
VKYGLLLLAVVVCISCADRNDENKGSATVYPYAIPTIEMEKLAGAKDCLAGFGHDENLYLWHWNVFEAQPSKYPLGSLKAVVVHDKRAVIALPTTGRPGFIHTVIMQELDKEQPLSKWVLGEQWGVSHITASQNGRYVGIDVIDTAEIYGSHRLGVLDPCANEIRWATTFKCTDLGPIVNAISVADNGSFIAAVGLNDGGWILVADAAQQKTLWEKRDTSFAWINCNDVCFSPDGKTTYLGTNGDVWGFDSLTGNFLSKWLTQARCVSVKASPDGRLVAGGTGPTGEVYIFDAQGGKVLKVLHTGQFVVYGLAFSPDSKFLATSGVRKTGIKIWKMPEVK